MRYLRRLRRRHVLVLVVCLAGAWWVFGDRLGTRDPACVYDLEAKKGPPNREVCTISLGSELDLLMAKLCSGESCEPDLDAEPPSGEANVFLGFLDRLPLEWVTPKLFPVASTLTVPAGTTLRLDFPREPGATDVLVGRIAVEPADARLDVRSDTGRSCTNDEGTVTGPRICRMSLTGDGAAARIAVTASAATSLDLACRSSTSCVVRFDSGSANLPRNSTCQCE